ncbi:MAG: nucleotide exchange factor GrpE [Clostridia bacterium]|nr:nucleotide exchange factor GrpE [Clostridia bacterium]
MAKDSKKEKTPETVPEEQGTPETVNETAEPEPSSGDEGVVLTKEEFEQAQQRIADMQKQIEELKANVDSSILDAQRIQAEFANFRKRNASIRSESIDDGAREVIKALLPVLDNFERAFANDDDSPFAKGIEQIYKQLIACLEKCGMEEIEADGQFDPNIHEAVMQDNESEAESGTITAVLQKGFRVKGKIIRHTMVKVRT